jgi:hypothetical protein
MKFFHLNEYKKTISQPMLEISSSFPSEEDIQSIINHSNSLGDIGENLTVLEKTKAYFTGDNKYEHIWLWSKNLEAFFILIYDRCTEQLLGYTCQDIDGQYGPCKISSPYLEDDYAADEGLIVELLNLIDGKPDEQNAYAVLESGNCYIQAIRESDGFVLEYQTVSLAFHFHVPEKLNVTDVKRAFISFNHGDEKWLDCLQWEHCAI